VHDKCVLHVFVVHSIHTYLVRIGALAGRFFDHVTSLRFQSFLQCYLKRRACRSTIIIISWFRRVLSHPHRRRTGRSFPHAALARYRIYSIQWIQGLHMLATAIKSVSPRLDSRRTEPVLLPLPETLPYMIIPLIVMPGPPCTLPRLKNYLEYVEGSPPSPYSNRYRSLCT
jgi:hypothetical protein